MEVLFRGSRFSKRPALTLCKSCSRRLRPQLTRSYTSATNAQPDIYDVVCIGGGPAGLSLLTALSKPPQSPFSAAKRRQLELSSGSLCLIRIQTTRVESRHGRPTSSPSRSPRSTKAPILEAPPGPVLEPVQLADAGVRAVPREHRRMGPYAARPRPAIPGDASLGRCIRRTDRVRLGTERGRGEDDRIHD